MELGIAALTVQQYERGFRHDNGRPVTIPEKIVLACEAVSRRLGKKEPVTRLAWKMVSEPILARVQAALIEMRIDRKLNSVLSFHHDHYAPFSEAIDKWLQDNGEKGYLKVEVPDEEALGGRIVVLDFFDQNDGFSFVLSFGGRSVDPLPPLF